MTDSVVFAAFMVLGLAALSFCVLMLVDSMRANGSDLHKAYTRGFRDGRIAGMKEAETMVWKTTETRTEPKP